MQTIIISRIIKAMKSLITFFLLFSIISGCADENQNKSGGGEEQHNKIEGAFGMKLGAIFDSKKAIGKGELTDGTVMYQFAPSNPFRSFKKYYVMITPKTHRIYSIWGIGNFDAQAKAEKEQMLILELLNKKYGSQKKEGLMDSLYDVKQVDQGDRSVVVKISGIMDVTLDIRYYDDKLRTQAEKERIELESKKVDSSGL